MMTTAHEILDRVFSTTHFCVVILNRDLKFVRVNKAYADTCGHPPEFFVGKNHFDLYPSEKIEAIFRQVVATANPFTIFGNPFEFPDHPELGITYWDWTLHPLMGEDGTVQGLLFALLDVTGRKRAEQVQHELWGRLLRLQDEERRRIARELHDTTAQNLAALNMNLELIEQAAPPADAHLRRLVSDCQQLVDRSVREIRTLSYVLHPPLLDDFGLLRALRDYAEGFSRRSGIRVDLEAPEDPGRLAGNIEIALFRILQEGLGNVHRHSGSTVAHVRLLVNGKEIRLEIQDEGQGLPPELVRVKNSLGTAVGVGLLGISERVQELGGSLELETGLPGALVRVILPLGEDSAKGGEAEACQLTPREREIVQLIAEGKSSKELASALGISLKTVETHRANIMRKLNAHSVVELVRFAVRNQLVRL